MVSMKNLLYPILLILFCNSCSEQEPTEVKKPSGVYYQCPEDKSDVIANLTLYVNNREIHNETCSFKERIIVDEIYEIDEPLQGFEEKKTGLKKTVDNVSEIGYGYAASIRYIDDFTPGIKMNISLYYTEEKSRMLFNKTILLQAGKDETRELNDRAKIRIRWIK